MNHAIAKALTSGLRHLPWQSFAQIADRTGARFTGDDHQRLGTILREAVADGVLEYGEIGSHGVVIPVFRVPA